MVNLADYSIFQVGYSEAVSIWQLERRIGQQLLLWSAGSILLGLALWTFGDAFWRGFGLQCGIWGLIDAIIAGFGLWTLKRKRRSAADSLAEAPKLKRLLLINAGLDIIYVLIGVGILILGTTEFAYGNGWGVIVQAAFLLFFDAWHGLVSVHRLETPNE